MVVGDEGTNGSLWCSPVAKTSRPTSSAFLAIVTMALIRWCSVNVRPVVGSEVTSPTVKIPNCMTAPELLSGPAGPGLPATTPLTRQLFHSQGVVADPTRLGDLAAWRESAKAIE